MEQRDYESSGGFQSTLPYGSDDEMEIIKEKRVISIHAPLRERRLKSGAGGISKKDFNPRSLTGATSFMHATDSPLTDFNPRSLTGATCFCPVC